MTVGVTWAFLVAAACGAGGLDEARALLRKGLLTEAERILVPIAAEADARTRAPALLLLGNVDYERGRYQSALERYAQAESDGAADDSLVGAARGNRDLAQQRLDRARELGRLEARLLAGVAASLALAALAVTWLTRRPRFGGQIRAGG